VTEYAEASIVVLPSLYESFGLVAAEALASGRPLLAFDNCLSSSHCPLPQKLNASKPDTRGEPPGRYDDLDRALLGVPEKPSECERFLFGFDAYADREGQLLGSDWKERSGLTKQGVALKFDSPFEKMLPAYEKPELAGPKKKKRRIGK